MDMASVFGTEGRGFEPHEAAVSSPLWRNGYGEIRAGGVSVLPVSQCTPPQRVSRLSVFRGQFDELEYNDWKFEQGNYVLSSNRSNIMGDLSRRVHNIMGDARNQPEFSYFS